MNSRAKRMSAADTLHDVLADDHDEIDQYWTRFRTLRSQFPSRAVQYFYTFYRGMQTHIDWEEQVLFPMYEDRVQRLGVTRAMRVEHREIKRILEKLLDAVFEGSLQNKRNENYLRKVLDRHNQKEEEALYPELSKFLSRTELERLRKQLHEAISSEEQFSSV